MPTDPFSTSQVGHTSPAENCELIVPDDDIDLSNIPRAIFVGTGGDVRLVPKGTPDAVTFKNVPSGSILPVRAVRVTEFGTTAEDLVALW